MWPFNLSVRLPIVALVGRYPANWLIGRESISQRIAPLIKKPCSSLISCGISVLFKTLSPSERQVTHALLTRPPLTFSRCKHQDQSVRLACVRHAASVRPEPGSNSLKYGIYSSSRMFKPIPELLFAHSLIRLRISRLFSEAWSSFLASAPLLLPGRFRWNYGSFFSFALFNFQGPFAPFGTVPDRPCSARRLIIIPNPSPFVNSFFDFFLISFKIRVFSGKTAFYSVISRSKYTKSKIIVCG